MAAIITLTRADSDSSRDTALGRGNETCDFAGGAEPAVARPGSGDWKCLYYYFVLSGRNVFSLRALGAIGNLHGYGLAFLKGFMTFRLNSAVMNENVFTTFL